ncbi:putative F-box/kelch-repeat protein-like, partial [Capsicum annuum]
MHEPSQILEINLISAQSLKSPDTKMRSFANLRHTCDSSIHQASFQDRQCDGNPTWNDKFLFRVPPEFISCETSGVSIEIYAIGYIKDFLVGTVRLLIRNCLNQIMKFGTSPATPAFTAVQVWRSSGSRSSPGVLNIAASVYSSEDFLLLNGLSAISFLDLMQAEKQNGRWWPRQRRLRLSRVSEPSLSDESYDFSNDTESTTSSASSSLSSTTTMSTPLKDWNYLRTVAEMEDIGSIQEIHGEIKTSFKELQPMYLPHLQDISNSKGMSWEPTWKSTPLLDNFVRSFDLKVDDDVDKVAAKYGRDHNIFVNLKHELADFIWNIQKIHSIPDGFQGIPLI